MTEGEKICREYLDSIPAGSRWDDVGDLFISALILLAVIAAISVVV